jgi:hypothetical protein
MSEYRLDDGHVAQRRIEVHNLTCQTPISVTELSKAISHLAMDHTLARTDRERVAEALYYRITTCKNMTDASGTCQTCQSDLTLLEEIYPEKYSMEAIRAAADARGIPRSTLSHAPEQPWSMETPIPADPTQSELVHEAYGNATAHGFSENWSTARVPEKLMLIVTEAAEAMEDFRLLKPGSDLRTMLYEYTYAYEGNRRKIRSEPEHDGVLGKPLGFLSELADIVIRIGDLVGNIQARDEFVRAVVEKMRYNRARPFKHGNKSC